MMANICSVMLPLASALQGAANHCVPQKRKKPPVEGLYGSGDDPFFRKWMENTRKVGLNSRTQPFGGTDRRHVSSLPVERTIWPMSASGTKRTLRRCLLFVRFRGESG